MSALAPSMPTDTRAARGAMADIGDPRVLAEQVKSLYAQLPFSMTGTTLGCLMIAALVWGRTPTPMLASWLACVLLNQAWRIVVLQRFRRQLRAGDIGPANAKRWCRWWMLGAAISGILFGFAGFWFFTGGSEVHEIALIIVLFLMCAGAVPLLATYPPSLYVFIVPALGPIAARMAFDGGNHEVIGAIVAISVVIMLFLGRHYGRLLIESIQMRFANVDLISELSREKSAADAAREDAELANQSKTRFFAAASHDLRQPLHAMGLFAGALHSRVKEPELANMVASINASVEALENQFNELLDISRIDSGAVSVRPESVDLAPMMERLGSEFGAEAAERGLRLRVIGSRKIVASDPALLERILRNLLANALRYTEAGGIVLAARRRRDSVSIEVWDSGIGIEPADQPHIFDEFYQVGNTERDRTKGVGLGLAIVRRLARLLGAELTFGSRVGRGTVFKLRVPVAIGPAAAVTTPAPLTGFAALRGRRVAVLDDEPTILAATQALLSDWGLVAITARTVDELRTLLAAQRASIDLLIVDFRLGADMDGVTAIKILRADAGHDIPAIIVTGQATAEVANLAKQQGAHMLAKPVSPAKLRALVSFKLGGE